MQKYKRSEEAGSRLNAGFRNASPLPEGLRRLDEREAQETFRMLYQKKPFEMFARFRDAQEKLSSLFGAVVELAEPNSGGIRVAARLEFLTTHRSIDPDLYDQAAGMGFNLTLKSVPILEGSFEERYERLERKQPDGSVSEYFEPRSVRTYLVSERNPDISKALAMAEGLLRFAQTLRPPGIAEDLPGNIVDISSARPPAQHANPNPKALRNATAGGSRY